MSRLEKSAKNITLTMGSNILDSILGIVSRTVFIKTIGAQYLGLAGLLQKEKIKKQQYKFHLCQLYNFFHTIGCTDTGSSFS